MTSTKINLAALGAEPLFDEPKPTCNLYRPDLEQFLEYSKVFFEQKRYTNDGVLSKKLEERLALFHETKRAISVLSGFWGLVIAISSLALPGKKEVIAPTLGYRRTDDIIAWSGLIPRLCDVDELTLGISVDSIKDAITSETALILAPHPMVRCCDAVGIESLGRELGIPVVFDSVEAGYKSLDGRRVGGFGDAEVFSMHSPKLLNAFEGGYITTNNIDLAVRMDNMKRFGFVGQDEIPDGRALNAKLNEMHAAMALACLEEVDKQLGPHQAKYKLYEEGLAEIPGLTLVRHCPTQREQSDYRLIVVEISSGWGFTREQTLRLLEAERILARPYYSPLHLKPVEYKRVWGALPTSERIYPNLMVLPSGQHVTESDVTGIIRTLNEIKNHSKQLKQFLEGANGN